MGSCQLAGVERGVDDPGGLEAGDVRGCAVERLAVGHADAEGAGGLGAAVGWEWAGDGEGGVLVGLVVEVHRITSGDSRHSVEVVENVTTTSVTSHERWRRSATPER